MKMGLIPRKSDKGFVFLWDTIDAAFHCAGILYRGKRLDIAILEVNIPESWARPDQALYDDDEYRILPFIQGSQENSSCEN